MLKGPRQVGKTSFLEKLGLQNIVYLDDPVLRRLANQDPRSFLDQYPSTLVLDEAAKAPELFSEIKRRVDEERRNAGSVINYWITGSNQTLLRKSVSESLAGRASYFDLNTLSVHELGEFHLRDQVMRGGWPELRSRPALGSSRYLNDLITSFIERDIVAAAGITKTAAFSTVLALDAGRVGQLFEASEVAQLASVDLTTVQAWNNLLSLNGVIELVKPYFSNLNKRLTKTPKIYFHDVSLAVRLQGWSDFLPLFQSPQIGHVFENIVFSEIHRYFINRGETPRVFHLRSKEKVEIDFLVELSNQRFVAIEAKMTPGEFSLKQVNLLESLKLNIVNRFCVSATQVAPLNSCQSILVSNIWDRLAEFDSKQYE